MTVNLVCWLAGIGTGYYAAWTYWRRRFRIEVVEMRRLSAECQRSIDRLEARRREGERLLRKFGARA